MRHRKRTIILINMNNLTGTTIYDFLEGWDYTPLRIKNAEILTPILSAGNRQLILFQFQEFSESEYAMLALIRKMNPQIPILATSPFISIRDTIRIIKAGAVDYISQPFNPMDLKRAIQKYDG
ncbi:hypothetical protein CEE37_12345 [candidate division LCP-89 bacterium B3_LCP]|uniref:Response regulatory domain-containing protein n=1 Tax=candidate division LCP-89 bacterium B3_LCP TaxID=2012998 RepID=A0A532UUC8_UNCL8|nr:MAG: hypothetical protein CEE37_12345 [candidate division LCP-89 bacterium B3_LCP]